MGLAWRMPSSRCREARLFGDKPLPFARQLGCACFLCTHIFPGSLSPPEIFWLVSLDLPFPKCDVCRGVYIRVRIAKCGYCGACLAARVDGSTAVVRKITAGGQLLTTHILPRLSSQLPFLFLHAWHQSATATLSLKPAHVEALRGICAKQGCVGRSIQGGVEGGCARQEGHGPWVLRQNPHGAHLEAKDMVWKKGGRDSGDLGHATTLPRQTALMSLIEVQSPRVLSAFFKVVGKRNFSNSKMRFIEPIRNLLSDLFSDN